MYLSFYGLAKEPFHITPDPAFLFMSESHKQALASIIYCIEKRKGFVAITGNVGVGKTTIVRSYLDSVSDKKLKIVYIFHANLTFENLLRTVFRELDVDPETDDQYEMIERLQQALIDEYREGNNIVLIVDEAQNMPTATLENLRMLSNLETTRDKLIQIVLIGQTEFEHILDRPELRQLRQRIAIRARIEPLDAEASKGYIRHRLERAGQKDASLFTKGAIDLIAEHAEGIPRVINVLCDNALITGYGYQSKRITPAIVSEVLKDFAWKKESTPAPSPTTPGNAGFFHGRPWHYGAVAVLLMLVIAFAVSSYRDRVANAIADALMAAHGQGLTARGELHSSAQTDGKSGTKALSARPDAPIRMVKVKKGDTLSTLVTEVYGAENDKERDRLVEVIKQSNPWITDPDMIVAGTEIVFPEISRGVR